MSPSRTLVNTTRPSGPDRRLGVVAGLVGEPRQPAAVRRGAEDVERVVDGPDITHREVRRRRALGAAQVRRGVDDRLAVRIEVAARRAPVPRAHHALVRAVEIHAEDLVARHAVARRLEDDLRAVEGEVRLRVLAAEGELPDVRQVRLAAPGGVRRSRGLGLGRRRAGFRGRRFIHRAAARRGHQQYEPHATEMIRHDLAS